MRGVALAAGAPERERRWEETEFTGTGFPNHFYLRYHCMRITFR